MCKQSTQTQHISKCANRIYAIGNLVVACFLGNPVRFLLCFNIINYYYYCCNYHHHH